MEMGARRSGSRISIVVLAILAFTLIVVGAVLIATGRLCITSSRRPVDRYEGASEAGEAGLSADLAATVDADSDGIVDNDDVLAAALAYIQTRPHYKSVYYPSGYPDDEHGVCTDVVAIACREAGYDLQALVAADVARRPEAYAIEIPDPAIDFRRTPNLKVFSMLMRSASRPTRATFLNGAVGTLSCMRGTLGSSPTVAMSAAFRISFIIPGRFSCAMRKTSCKAMDTSSGIIAWIPHVSRCCHRAQIRIMPSFGLGGFSKVVPQ